MSCSTVFSPRRRITWQKYEREAMPFSGSPPRGFPFLPFLCPYRDGLGLANTVAPVLGLLVVVGVEVDVV
jgi:hypothetical protein